MPPRLSWAPGFTCCWRDAEFPGRPRQWPAWALLPGYDWPRSSGSSSCRLYGCRKMRHVSTGAPSPRVVETIDASDEGLWWLRSWTSAPGQTGRARAQRIGQVGKRVLDRQEWSGCVRLLCAGLRAIRFLQGIIIEGPDERSLAALLRRAAGTP